MLAECLLFLIELFEGNLVDLFYIFLRQPKDSCKLTMNTPTSSMGLDSQAGHSVSSFSAAIFSTIDIFV